MAISKTMRFAVLKRDNFTCRYCRSKDGELTVDHVVPVSLGGEDIAENLVAACLECNQGKGSAPLDAENVADISEDALRWAEAMNQACAELEEDTSRQSDALGTIYTLWMDLAPSYSRNGVLPSDWEAAVTKFMRSGLSVDLLIDATYIVFAREDVRIYQKFRYFCGICRNRVKELERRAREIIEKEEEEHGS